MGFMEFIKTLAKSAQGTPFNPAVFDHPLALKTSWTPQAGGGANFKTRTLKKLSSSELRFIGSSAGKIFAGVFIAFPMIFIVVGATAIMADGFKFEMLLFMLIPLIFIAIGIYLFKVANTALIFDKNSGLFYKGKKAPSGTLNPREDKNTFKLSSIKALQIIPETVRGKNSSYTSYEINLIFDDGNRYNVADHGKRTSIEEDAITLSDFLDVPLWNKITGTTYPTKKKVESSSNYDNVNRYDTPDSYEEPTYVDTETDDLDAPYDSMKRRKL